MVTLARSPEELGRGVFLAFLLLLYTVFFLRVPVPAAAGTEIVLARLIALSVLAVVAQFGDILGSRSGAAA